MKNITINNVAGELILRGKSIPILEWNLTVKTVKLKRKVSLGAFIPHPPTTSGSAIISSPPILGKLYNAIFAIRKRKLKIFAKIWITEADEVHSKGKPTKIKIEFIVIGSVAVCAGRTKKNKKRK